MQDYLLGLNCFNQSTRFEVRRDWSEVSSRFVSWASLSTTWKLFTINYRHRVYTHTYSFRAIHRYNNRISGIIIRLFINSLSVSSARIAASEQQPANTLTIIARQPPRKQYPDRDIRNIFGTRGVGDRLFPDNLQWRGRAAGNGGWEIGTKAEDSSRAESRATAYFIWNVNGEKIMAMFENFSTRVSDF